MTMRERGRDEGVSVHGSRVHIKAMLEEERERESNPPKLES